MKKIILSLVLLFVFSSGLNAQWTWQNPRPQGDFLYDIQFIDSLNGWACGNFGAVLKTTDGGNNWKLYQTPAKELLFRIFFVNKNKGWVSSYSRQTFVTYDGGLSWDTVKALNNMYITRIQFLNEKTGFVLANDSSYAFSSIYKTTDAGLTWNIYNQQPVYWSSSSFFFLDENYGWISTGAGLERTTDGGKSWQSSSIPGFQTSIAQMQFIDKNYGFLVGNSPEPFSSDFFGIFALTSDGGATWHSRDIPDRHATLNDVHFTPDLKGYISTGDSRIFYTTNAGVDWKTLESTVNKFTFVNNLKAWGIAGLNVIKSTSDGWMTSTVQTPSATSAMLWTVSAFDTNNIAAGGQFGDIVLSSDGGKTWLRSYSSFNKDVFVNSIFYKNSNELWAVASNASVLWSMDKGKSWNSLQLDSPNWLSDITFIDDTTGFILGGRASTGFLYTSKTAGSTPDKNGLTWQLSHEFPFEVEKIKFTKSGIGYIAGNKAILKSTDRGKSWQRLQLPAETFFLTLDAIDDYVWTNAGDKVLLSTDAGITWNTYKAFDYQGSSFFSVHAISFADKLNGLMGLDGRIARTTDGGKSWNEDKQITSDYFYSLDYFDKDHAWAVGDAGMILNYNAHLTNIYDIAQSNLVSYCLQQNYPNPFNPQTTIRFSVAQSGMVCLKVFDILGNEIAVLVNEIKPSGTYSVNFDAGRYKLSSGVYIYRVQINNFMQSKKLLFVK